MILSRRAVMFAPLALGMALAIGPVAAQTYPSKPVTMVVPFAAGGPTDTLARILAQAMSERLGQSVVIENVPGAGGSTGAVRVMRAQPDGYTILISDLALPAAPLLNRNVTYDLSKDVTPLGVVNAGPMVLISRDGLATDAAALFARIKADSAKVTLGHSGLGSNAHMCGLFVQQALGVKLTEVPYRGAGPAMNDMLGGSLDVMCEQSTTAIPQIEAKRVIAHGVTSAGRLPVLPSTPTLAEVGLGGFDFTVWHGLYAPAGTPPVVVARLNEALAGALADPSVRRRYAEAGRTEFPAGQRSPEAHRELLSREVRRLKEALDRAGVQPAN
jgi:tripartite-type tricarboxylate transporter receptor subunit TctC